MVLIWNSFKYIRQCENMNEKKGRKTFSFIQLIKKFSQTRFSQKI